MRPRALTLNQSSGTPGPYQFHWENHMHIVQLQLPRRQQIKLHYARRSRMTRKRTPRLKQRPCHRPLKERKPFQPLGFGDPGWGKSAGRPRQKLPTRFRDAVGRNFVFP
ncbi:hypothetical protein F5B17DRAFT_425030 [Nemania serpens]|nr:hypothetical protein F5B17DRAFT_425030 [Nemania serpens]